LFGTCSQHECVLTRGVSLVIVTYLVLSMLFVVSLSCFVSSFPQAWVLDLQGSGGNPLAAVGLHVCGTSHILDHLVTGVTSEETDIAIVEGDVLLLKRRLGRFSRVSWPVVM